MRYSTKPSLSVRSERAVIPAFLIDSTAFDMVFEIILPSPTAWRFRGGFCGFEKESVLGKPSDFKKAS